LILPVVRPVFVPLLPSTLDGAFYALASVGDESLLPFIERVINGQDGRDYGLLTRKCAVSCAAREGSHRGQSERATPLATKISPLLSQCRREAELRTFDDWLHVVDDGRRLARLA
jgi:hypothetical protein